jgi:hypothetical protein
MKVTIKKDSEAAKAFESLREDKQEFKENVQSGKFMPPEIKNVPPEVEKLYELAEQSWEGCDGCDENDKYFFMKGFQAGYNRAKPDEISDEEIEKAAAHHEPMVTRRAWVSACKWYREQLKKQ